MRSLRREQRTRRNLQRLCASLHMPSRIEATSRTTLCEVYQEVSIKDIFKYLQGRLRTSLGGQSPLGNMFKWHIVEPAHMRRAALFDVSFDRKIFSLFPQCPPTLQMNTAMKTYNNAPPVQPSNHLSPDTISKELLREPAQLKSSARQHKLSLLLLQWQQRRRLE